MHFNFNYAFLYKSNVMQVSTGRKYIKRKNTQSLYLGDFLLHSLPVLCPPELDLPSLPGTFDGASRAVIAVKILLLLSSVPVTLLSSPLLFALFSQSLQLPVVLLFESGYFLDVLVVESFPQCLQLRCQARRPTGPMQVHASL